MRAAIRTHDPSKILDVLTEKRSTFSRGDLNRMLAKVIFDGQARAALNNEILSSPEVVGLKENAAASVSRYTTRSVLEAEERVIADAAALAEQQHHGWQRPASWRPSTGIRRSMRSSAVHCGIPWAPRGWR